MGAGSGASIENELLRGSDMDIGLPKRVIEIDPASLPVPEPAPILEPSVDPLPAPEPEPAQVPER